MVEEKKDDKNMTCVFDDVLMQIGEFGRYQRRIFLLLCLPGMLCAMHKLAWVFLGAYASHRCLLPFESLSNASFALPGQVANMSLPWDAARDSWSQCRRLDANFSEQYFEDGVPATQTVPCEDWVFDHSEYESSAVFELFFTLTMSRTFQFSLVCDWEWARAMANTLLVVGGLTGALVFGNLSDRFGRRPVFFSALVLQVSVGILASLAPNYWTFVLARFVVGAAVPGVYIVAYVIGMEMVGPSKRQYAGIALQVFFSIGYMLTALFAFLVKDWRNLQFALSVPGLFFLVYWWLIPESPRWLVGQGRVAEASIILQRAAAENDLGVSPSLIDKLLSSVSEKLERDAAQQKKKPSFFQLMRYPTLRRNTLIVLLVWLVNGISYFGLSWNTADLGGNDYVNFSISGVVEIPANFLVLVVVNRSGRVPMQSGTLVVAALALVMTSLVPAEWPWLTTSLAMVGKLAVTASYGTAYVLSGEIFPTSVRNAGMGACSTMAAIGAMLASFIVLLTAYWPQLPFLILGCAALSAGLLASLLPETLNRDLPDTLEDGESFGRARAKAKSTEKEIDLKI